MTSRRCRIVSRSGRERSRNCRKTSRYRREHARVNRDGAPLHREGSRLCRGTSRHHYRGISGSSGEISGPLQRHLGIAATHLGTATKASRDRYKRRLGSPEEVSAPLQRHLGVAGTVLGSVVKGLRFTGIFLRCVTRPARLCGVSVTTVHCGKEKETSNAQLPALSDSRTGLTPTLNVYRQTSECTAALALIVFSGSSRAEEFISTRSGRGSNLRHQINLDLARTLILGASSLFQTCSRR